MKNFFLCLIALFVTTQSFAQIEPGKAFKKAKSALVAYNTSPQDNGDKLKEAVEMIGIAVTGEEEKALSKTWALNAEILNTVTGSDFTQVAIGTKTDLDPSTEKYVYDAVSSAAKASELAVKKYEKKEAATLMMQSLSGLNELSNFYIGKKDYASAYKPNVALLEGAKAYEAASGEPFFESKEAMNNQMFIAAICGSSANDKGAMKYYEELYNVGFQDAAVYSGYFNQLIEKGDEAKAMEVMAKAQELFPGNTDLLYAEINYYLKNDKLDQLEDKLKQAIAKEPKNVSLYSTLGFVYDSNFQRALDNNDIEEANKQFASALQYYEQAVGIDPNFTDGIYSLGALYYNKAAKYSTWMQDLGVSAEDQKKYDEYKGAMDELFADALPYFQKVESINPNDRNTLIALKEIFAKQSKFDLVNEFKKRLEVVDGGGKVDGSYFK